MKSKKQRKNKWAIAKFKKALEKNNPSRNFYITDYMDTVVHVDCDLWKLCLPEALNILVGKDRKEIEMWAYIKVEIAPNTIVFLKSDC